MARPLAGRSGWQTVDVRAVDTARLLAADAVQKAGNGHPGTAMSLAPLAYLLFQNVMVHDPADDQWLGRDRFVLSAGHTSLTLYIQLFLSGYGLEIADLAALRTWGSKTPGHPEYRHTRGVEITTGPLGQGLGAAVGMAMAARRERGLLDPEAPPGESPFDHHVYVIASDGDMMEGVSSEASSLAGHQQLGSLIVFYDQNHISIEDDTDVSFSEDVATRYAAYGWHVQSVSWRRPDGYVEDVDAVLDAVTAARQETGRPSIIVLNTIIGWPTPPSGTPARPMAPPLARTRSRPRKRCSVSTRRNLSPWRSQSFGTPARSPTAGRAAHAAWQPRYQAWRPGNPDRAALLDRLQARRLPDGWTGALPGFEPDPEGMATRKASGTVLVGTGARYCRSYGAGRRIWPRATTPPWTARTHSSRRAAGRQGMARRFLRADAALRHPRARHGRGAERHRAAIADQGLRRHVPDLQRLHARRRYGWLP